ncbi:MAG: ABC transporter permease subunit, partial [Anaerolineae bacterium]
MRLFKTILSKEFVEIFNNKLLVFTVIAPLVILPILPLAAAYTTTLDIDPITAEDVKLFVEKVPQWASLPPQDVFQVVILQQMMTFFLIIPLIVPLSIAAFSIIGEKKAHTLEPLLATPVSTASILVGKSIAAGTPGLVATWLSYALSLVGLRFIIISQTAWRVIAGPVWWVAMGLVAPLLTFFSV